MQTSKPVYLTCKDYTVSKKKFDLLYHKELEMLETFPKPTKEKLGSYYISENYISHTDSQKTFTDKLYQLVKKYTLGRKLKLIASFNTSGKSVLDLGCGTGDFLFKCYAHGYQVTGVEPNNSARLLAKHKFGETAEASFFSDFDEITSQKFDIITLWHVLEHVPNLKDYIEKLKTCLQKNGVIIIAVPNFKSYDAKYYKQFWAAYDVPRHLWHFSKKSIQDLFETEGMQLKKVVPMKFDSFYVSMLSEQYKNSKNNFLKAFLIGLWSNLKAMVTKEYSSLIYVIKQKENNF